MGQVVTFYSFKGGVGRTMALANVAVLLAQRGKSVLAVDWDLEAPGLHRFFEGRIPPANGDGLMGLLLRAAKRGTGAAAVDWKSYTCSVNLSNTGSLDLLAAGADTKDYVRNLQEFDWEDFFLHREGGAFLEEMREQWRESYEFTLVDSRTGLTDVGGICTIQLPDILVAVFSANHQSIDGVREAIRRAQEGRQKLAYDRMPLLVLPLPSRFDGRAERDDTKLWHETFAREMSEYYDTWLPSGTDYLRVVERLKVPHITKFSFGEQLPVLMATESLTDPEGMGYVYDQVAELLVNNFRRADQTILGESIGPASREVTERLEDLILKLDDSISRQLALQFILQVVPAEFAGIAGMSLAVLAFAFALLPQWLGGLGVGLFITASLQLRQIIQKAVAERRELRRLQDQLREALALHSGNRERLLSAYEDALRAYRRIQSRSAVEADLPADPGEIKR